MRSSSRGSVSPSRKDSCLLSPRSFQSALEVLSDSDAELTYSACRRQARKERNKFVRNLQAMHRESSRELAEMAERATPRIRDRMTAETRQAEEAWQKFSDAMKEAEAEDMRKHRNHLCQLVNEAGPRVVDRLDSSTKQFQNRCARERREALMNEANMRRESECYLQKITQGASKRVDDDLSPVTKDVRRRLGELRSRVRAHDTQTFAMQEQLLEQIRENAGVRVESWCSPEVRQARRNFHSRGSEHREMRSEAMKGFSKQLRQMVDGTPVAIDSYIDEEVKASARGSSSSRRPLIDLSEVAKLEAQMGLAQGMMDEIASWPSGARASSGDGLRCATDQPHGCSPTSASIGTLQCDVSSFCQRAGSSTPSSVVSAPLSAAFLTPHRGLDLKANASVMTPTTAGTTPTSIRSGSLQDDFPSFRSTPTTPPPQSGSFASQISTCTSGMPSTPRRLQPGPPRGSPVHDPVAEVMVKRHSGLSCMGAQPVPLVSDVHSVRRSLQQTPRVAWPRAAVVMPLAVTTGAGPLADAVFLRPLSNSDGLGFQQ